MSNGHTMNSSWPRLLILAASLGIAGCAALKEKKAPLEDLVAATPIAEPPKPVEIVEVPKVLPMPGQLKAAAPASKAPTVEPRDPKQRVVRANTAARMEPTQRNFMNATQVWSFSSDALYQVYSSPERITDIALQPGEELVSVSAGDTVRWIIGDTTSGTGATQRSHILVKPTRDDLRTNLVINTNRRTYHLELTSTPDAWMASVAWEYPLDQLLALRTSNQRAEVNVPRAEGLSLDNLNFRYEISGDSPSWKPVRAFDDGMKVYIQFPEGIAQDELPPLFIRGKKGDAQLVNYRVREPYYIVDRLFDSAELRLGDKKTAQSVRINRMGKRKGAQ